MKEWEEEITKAQKQNLEHNRRKSRISRFFIILGTGVASCATLWGPIGMVAGFIPVVVNTFLLTVLLEFDIL